MADIFSQNIAQLNEGSSQVITLTSAKFRSDALNRKYRVLDLFVSYIRVQKITLKQKSRYLPT